MKLTLYMCKAHVKNISQVLKPETQARAYKDITNRERLDEGDELRIYALQKAPTVPSWVSFIAGHADADVLAGMKTTSASVLIVWKAETPDGERLFTASHGQGFTLIEQGLVEPRFGLKVTLNSIAPYKIKALEAKNIGSRAAARRETSRFATSINGFNFEDDSEVLGSLSGVAIDDELGFSLSGGDSLKVTIKDLQFAQLTQVAQTAYERFRRTTYKNNFDFIDHFELVRDPLRASELDHALTQAFAAATPPPSLHLHYPDHTQFDECDMFKVKVPATDETFDDLNIQDVFGFVRNNSDGVDLTTLKSEVKLLGLSNAGEARTKQYPLYSFLGFETTLEGQQYVLQDGKWYKFDVAFTTGLDDWLQRNIKITALPLPAWPAADTERQFVHGLHGPDFMSLDRLTFQPKRHKPAVVAHFYHRPTNRLGVIKKIGSASSLGHIVANALYAADALRDDNHEAWSFLLDAAHKQWPDLTKDGIEASLGYVVVLAGVPDATALPVFHKIALKKAVRGLKKMGLKTEVQFIM